MIQSLKPIEICSDFRRAFWMLFWLLSGQAASASLLVTIPAQFEHLSDDFPSQFRLGQDVSMQFGINEEIEGTPVESIIFYENAITEFSILIPEATFTVSSGSGNIEYFNDTKEILFRATPSQEVILDGMEFLSLNVFYSLDEGIPLTSDPLQQFEDFKFTKFEMNFLDINTGSVSNGSVMDTIPTLPGGINTAVIPEPAQFSLILGGIGFIYLLKRRVLSPKH